MAYKRWHVGIGIFLLIVTLKFGRSVKSAFVSFYSPLLLALCCFSRKFGAVGTQTTPVGFSRLEVYRSVSSVLEFTSDLLRSEKHIFHISTSMKWEYM